MIISEKDVVDRPIMDKISKGDTTVNIKASTHGDHLIVGFSTGFTGTVEKEVDGK
ncbi:MAG: hypothetical protein Q4P25_05045 [Tissierellia bacterium]|nr:hypothetical protein [Tissierellia bacterium]